MFELVLTNNMTRFSATLLQSKSVWTKFLDASWLWRCTHGKWRHDFYSICTNLQWKPWEVGPDKLEANKNLQVMFLLSKFLFIFSWKQNRLKFKQNQMRDKDRAYSFLKSSNHQREIVKRQVVDNSSYFVFMKFLVFPLFLWLKQDRRQECNYSMWHYHEVLPWKQQWIRRKIPYRVAQKECNNFDS